MAQSGRKVLLIDADMRLPSQHRIWNLLNDAGLSNVLVGQAQLRNVKEVMPTYPDCWGYASDGSPRF